LNAAKSDRQKPARYVGRHPDACLHEIAKHFDCTAAAVRHAPKQMRMARKKDRRLQRTRPGQSNALFDTAGRIFRLPTRLSG
ncbi:hypothetical protein P1738_001657, partial [Neisseria gonorrhoeae]